MLCSGDAQHVLGDRPGGVEGGTRHAPKYSIRFLFLFLLLSATIGLLFFYKTNSFVIICRILSRFFSKKSACLFPAKYQIRMILILTFLLVLFCSCRVSLA